MARRFPGANLIAQILRQITKPLSKTIVKHVKKHSFFRNYVLVELGRFYYWCQNKMKRSRRHDAKTSSENLTTKKKPVDDVRAMELGTQMLLEAFMFGFLWGALFYETKKAADRSKAADAQKVKEMNDLEALKDQLIREIESQENVIRSLKEFVAEYSKQVKCPLPKLPRETQNNDDTTT